MQPRAAGQSPVVTAAGLDFKAMYGYQHLFLKKTLGIARIFVYLTLRRLQPVPVAFVHLRARDRERKHIS